MLDLRLARANPSGVVAPDAKHMPVDRLVGCSRYMVPYCGCVPGSGLCVQRRANLHLDLLLHKAMAVSPFMGLQSQGCCPYIPWQNVVGVTVIALSPSYWREE